MATAGTFSPDRPNLGSSTAVVPRHQSMIEVGLGLGGTLGASPALLIPGLVGRVGLKPERLELRIGAPGLVVPFEGPLVGTPLTIGTKWVGPQDTSVRWSLVPTASVPLPGNGDPLAVLAGDLEANLAIDGTTDDWGLFATSNAGGGRDAAWLGGGAGAWYDPDGVGLYAQTGWQGGLLVGGGGWWILDEGLQADIGVDVWPGLPATVLVRAGVSVQR